MPVITLILAFLNRRSSSVDTAASSSGTMRGSSSMRVTWLPKRLKIDANSTPTAPLPMIAIDFGDLGQVNGLVARDDARPIDLDAGHAAGRRARRHDDLPRGDLLRATTLGGHLDAAVTEQPAPTP